MFLRRATGAQGRNSIKTSATYRKMQRLWHISMLRLTCSSGPCVVGEGDRGRPLLGNGKQVCIGPVGQTWAAEQNTHIE